MTVTFNPRPHNIVNDNSPFNSGGDSHFHFNPGSQPAPVIFVPQPIVFEVEKVVVTQGNDEVHVHIAGSADDFIINQNLDGSLSIYHKHSTNQSDLLDGLSLDVDYLTFHSDAVEPLTQGIPFGGEDFDVIEYILQEESGTHTNGVSFSEFILSGGTVENSKSFTVSVDNLQIHTGDESSDTTRRLDALTHSSYNLTYGNTIYGGSALSVGSRGAIGSASALESGGFAVVVALAAQLYQGFTLTAPQGSAVDKFHIEGSEIDIPRGQDSLATRTVMVNTYQYLTNIENIDHNSAISYLDSAINQHGWSVDDFSKTAYELTLSLLRKIDQSQMSTFGNNYEDTTSNNLSQPDGFSIEVPIIFEHPYWHAGAHNTFISLTEHGLSAEEANNYIELAFREDLGLQDKANFIYSASDDKVVKEAAGFIFDSINRSHPSLHLSTGHHQSQQPQQPTEDINFLHDDISDILDDLKAMGPSTSGDLLSDFYEAIDPTLEGGAGVNLESIDRVTMELINGMTPADKALFLSHLSSTDRARILSTDLAKGAEILNDLYDTDKALAFDILVDIADQSPDSAADIVKKMNAQKTVEILEMGDTEDVRKILQELTPAQSAVVMMNMGTRPAIQLINNAIESGEMQWAKETASVIVSLASISSGSRAESFRAEFSFEIEPATVIGNLNIDLWMGPDHNAGRLKHVQQEASLKGMRL